MPRVMGLALALALPAVASTARADLNASYRGVERFTGTDTTATVQISIAKDRIAFVIHGSRDVRMLYWKDRATMRFVDDTGKSYLDLERCTTPGGGLLSSVQGQLSQLPPDQRAMAEEMLKGSMGEEGNESKTEFVRTKDVKKVLDHDCTMVKIQRDGETRAEYCSCTSPDFKLTDAERTALNEANQCIHNLFMTVRSAKGDPSGALEWDADSDGFPLLSRCVDGETVTLEVTMESFDRKKVADSLFAVPTAYSKSNPAEADSTGGE
ncbi:MAG: hypothetical protein ACRENN_08645 [Candidatus Eiseniibacteriota bacterium]